MKKPTIIVLLLSIIFNMVLAILLAAKSHTLNITKVQLTVTERNYLRSLESISEAIQVGLSDAVQGELNVFLVESDRTSNDVAKMSDRVDIKITEKSTPYDDTMPIENILERSKADWYLKVKPKKQAEQGASSDR
ncbi:hypothetical protein [Oceaniferula spumae]